MSSSPATSGAGPDPVPPANPPPPRPSTPSVPILLGILFCPALACAVFASLSRGRTESVMIPLLLITATLGSALTGGLVGLRLGRLLDPSRPGRPFIIVLIMAACAVASFVGCFAGCLAGAATT